MHVSQSVNMVRPRKLEMASPVSQEGRARRPLYYAAIVAVVVIIGVASAVVYEDSASTTVHDLPTSPDSIVNPAFSTVNASSGSSVMATFMVNSTEPIQIKIYLTDESFYTSQQLGHNSSIAPDFIRNITSIVVTVGGLSYNVTQSPYTDSQGDSLNTNATGSPAIQLQQGSSTIGYDFQVPRNTPVGQYLISIVIQGYAPSEGAANLVYEVTVNTN
jgi:hypothetical protein